jgi:hypothetical protein
LQEAHFITGSGRAIEMLHLQAPLAGCWGEPVGAANYPRLLVLLSAFGCSSQLRRNQGKNCQSGAGEHL